jgi:hypothetical protein
MLWISFAAVDVGRLIYTYAAISSAAREGARTVALQQEATSDCLAIQRMELAGQGFPLKMDPNSLPGNSDPNNPGGTLQPTTPGPNQGYIYIWPAVARTAPQDQSGNCQGAQRAIPQSVRHVAVEVQYHFVPFTPLPGTADFVVKTVAVETTEY